MNEAQLYITLLIAAVLVLAALCFLMYLCGREKPEPKELPFPVVKLTPGEADLVFQCGTAEELEVVRDRILELAEDFNAKVDEHHNLKRKGFEILRERYGLPDGYVLQVSYINDAWYLYPVSREEKE